MENSKFLAKVAALFWVMSLAHGLPIIRKKSFYQSVRRFQEKALDQINGATRQSQNYVWSYKDVSSWSNSYPTCGGSMQSPIQIDPRSSVKTNYDRISFGNYDNVDSPFTIHNNGHTAFLNLPSTYPQEKLPYIQNGGLPDNKFIFAQMHFHWGSDSSKGSEHQIRFKPNYPAELHLVHFNQKYGTFSEASNHQDGLAVLGIFLQVVDADNSNFRPIIDKLSNIRSEGDEATLGSNLSPAIYLPTNTDKFYRYTGSLTTPGCNEIVIWTVFEKPIPISESQPPPLFG